MAQIIAVLETPFALSPPIGCYANERSAGYFTARLKTADKHARFNYVHGWIA